MRLFSQRGFRGTTTKEIAVAAGVSEAMVFRHFANKEVLYSAIPVGAIIRRGFFS
jgi:TetR/AcrR family transcriptional regulator